MHLKFLPLSTHTYTVVSFQSHPESSLEQNFPHFREFSTRILHCVQWRPTMTSYTHEKTQKTVNLKNAHEWKSMCSLSARHTHTVTKANWLFIHIKLSIPFCYHLVPNLTIYVWSLIEKWSKFMVLCYLTTEVGTEVAFRINYLIIWPYLRTKHKIRKQDFVFLFFKKKVKKQKCEREKITFFFLFGVYTNKKRSTPGKRSSSRRYLNNEMGRKGNLRPN